MNDNRTNLDFADELLKNGVKFYPSYNSKGNFNGSSFELAEHVENFDANRFMGSQLSNTLKKDKLLAILEKYEQRRMENLENARINEQIGKSIGKIRESLERTKRVSGKIRELTDASEHRNICSAGLISREYDRFTEESKHISESIGIVCGEFEKLNRTRDKFIEQIEVVNEFIRTRNKERTRRFRNSIAKIRNECPSIEEKLHRLDCQSAIAWLFDTKYRLGYIVKRFDESVKQLGKAAGRINNNVNELFKVIKAVNFKYKYIKSGEKLRGTLTKYFDFNDRKHGILQTQEGSPRYFPVDNEPKFVVGKEYNVAREGNNYYVTPLEPKKKIEVQAQRVDKPKFKNEM